LAQAILAQANAFRQLRVSLGTPIATSTHAMAHEPGCSLRAEVRRLRNQQHELLTRLDLLFSCDQEIASRAFPLLTALQQHKDLDRRNGYHCHNHGVALSNAKGLTSERRRKMRWVKKAGDSARHAPFCKVSSCDDSGVCNDDFEHSPMDVDGGHGGPSLAIEPSDSSEALVGIDSVTEDKCTLTRDDCAPVFIDEACEIPVVQVATDTAEFFADFNQDNDVAHDSRAASATACDDNKAAPVFVDSAPVSFERPLQNEQECDLDNVVLKDEKPVVDVPISFAVGDRFLRIGPSGIPVPVFILRDDRHRFGWRLQCRADIGTQQGWHLSDVELRRWIVEGRLVIDRAL